MYRQKDRVTEYASLDPLCKVCDACCAAGDTNCRTLSCEERCRRMIANPVKSTCTSTTVVAQQD